MLSVSVQCIVIAKKSYIIKHVIIISMKLTVTHSFSLSVCLSVCTGVYWHWLGECSKNNQVP